MRFLFVTLQHIESEFYRRVGGELRGRGHDVAHVTWSRQAARRFRRGGDDAYCLPDALRAVGSPDLDREVERLEAEYDMRNLREVYTTDIAAEGLPERRQLERTVRHFAALERIFDAVRPDAIVPEVGSETVRTAAHLIGLRRDIPVYFLFYTLFPDPLRLYVDTMHAPIVPVEEVRALEPDERTDIESFIADFTARREPIRPYRRRPVSSSRARVWLRHAALKATVDRDNEYLTPLRWLRRDATEYAQAAVNRAYYTAMDWTAPFVYFPLHVTDDYKIKRLIPHCMDQASIVEQIARALPQGQRLVVKEHPMSVGRTRPSLLRRLARVQNVEVVNPFTSSHELIERASAVAVISSTVGLEAVMYSKPVLTLGQPFYAGYGLTVDVDSFREIPAAVSELLVTRPDPERALRFLHAAKRHCHPGAPALVDQSDANAARLAFTLDRATRREALGVAH